MTRLLLLAGTAEARQMARALSNEPRVMTIASLAGATRTPEPLGVLTRIGGFGGRKAFGQWLRKERVDAVLDATHPFAVSMSHRTFDVCIEEGVSYMQFLRTPWSPEDGDTWSFVNSEEDVHKHVPEGARVLLTTGGHSADRFGPLPGRVVFGRRVDATNDPFPFETGRWIVSRPPYRTGDEIALLQRHRIDWVVARNSGGSSGRAKLDAARELGVPVAMIRRPMQPESPRVATVSAALAWVRSLV
ncbi:cobalt-precorrin-6A reductase [Anianabacter salinae]|uniref:cobalt-precorrin-6A reductase n=1 Tax=Anianabacter salinae TaxID=2851023 RepID=UPI00225E027D|nr:cobalt-precorrin-6A reductase [Anianabacter salinae]MBV0911992.1 cobalt-precorrin-6A reductase [Anianabacter salinae]